MPLSLTYHIEIIRVKMMKQNVLDDHQVENEYGSYDACNMNHKIWLRNLISSYVKTNAVLFTTDGNADFFLRCGAIPDVYATVDFGTSKKYV